MSFEEDNHWINDYRTGTGHNEHRYHNRREISYLVRRPSGWYIPHPTVHTMCSHQRGFDADRPAWLSRADFTPADTSPSMLAKLEFSDIDFTRPELWMHDGECFSEAPADERGGQHGHEDEIDEPFDHRAPLIPSRWWRRVRSLLASHAHFLIKCCL
jgi:hypothetical protein